MATRVMTKAEVKKLMNRPIKRSARTIAKALECYRMASEEQKHNCPNRKCPYNNNSSEYGYWCCSNSILFEAVRKLRQQDEHIKKLKKQIDRVWTGM